MIRKSKEQRIADAKASAPVWEKAGRIKEAHFMRDMVVRLERGQGLSPKQRNWLDELCSSPPPPPPATALPVIARLDACMAYAQAQAMTRVATTLQDFRNGLCRGYKLSEKQQSYLERLMSDIEKERSQGRWQPSAETVADADFVCSVLEGRGHTWKGTHSGTMSAVAKIRQWQKNPEVRVDEWCFNKVLEAAGPALRELRKPKFEEGEMVTVTIGDPPWATSSPTYSPIKEHIGIICSCPVAVDGKVGYDVLIDSKPVRLVGELIKRVK